MAFKLSARSRANLKGVRPDLVALVEAAILETPVDFAIISNGGLRTAAQQNQLYRDGASKIDGYRRISKHQPQRDGYGWAVDLVPYAAGGVRWEWDLIYPIAATMARLSRQRGVALIWGGVWDKPMSAYPDDARAIEAEVRAYTIRHPGPDFIDGPHYELIQ